MSSIHLFRVIVDFQLNLLERLHSRGLRTVTSCEYSMATLLPPLVASKVERQHKQSDMTLTAIITLIRFSCRHLESATSNRQILGKILQPLLFLLISLSFALKNFYPKFEASKVQLAFGLVEAKSRSVAFLLASQWRLEIDEQTVNMHSFVAGLSSTMDI